MAVGWECGLKKNHWVVDWPDLAIVALEEQTATPMKMHSTVIIVPTFGIGILYVHSMPTRIRFCTSIIKVSP